MAAAAMGAVAQEPSDPHSTVPARSKKQPSRRHHGRWRALGTLRRRFLLSRKQMDRLRALAKKDPIVFGAVMSRLDTKEILAAAICRYPQEDFGEVERMLADARHGPQMIRWSDVGDYTDWSTP